MSEAKIEIMIGEIKFSGEGDQKWLSEQLDKILSKAEELIKIVPPKSKGADDNISPADLSRHNEIAKKSLANFLKLKNAETNQNRKFLATAVWLEAKGKKRVATADVTSALSDANQKKLGNASENLNQNVNKGFCEKDGKQFYVTEEGKQELGIS